MQEHQEEVIAALTPASNLEAVVARLEQISAALPQDDGLSCFNRLYLEVTRAVGAALASGELADVEFAHRLEVNLANLYFEAVRLGFFPSQRRRVGQAWAPLFSSRQTGGILPERFALFGMHAHLHHDLCLAVVRTCVERALAPEKGSAQHLDFQRLGKIWHAPLQAAQALATGESMATWSCLEARELAWNNAGVLWHLRSSAELTADYLSLLERDVVATSRGLLAKAG
jgi:hypothetical protein